MAAKKAKGDDWFSSLDAELEKKTREIIENVGEQNVARLELNKTLIEDFWKVWKRFNKINVHFALEPSYTNWGVFPDTFPDGDWHWRPGFNTAAVQSIQLLDRSMDQGRVRSEEHTSELQSQSNLVCRLLLEKKKPDRRPLTELLMGGRPWLPVLPCLRHHRAAHTRPPDGSDPDGEGVHGAHRAQRLERGDRSRR